MLSRMPAEIGILAGESAEITGLSNEKSPTLVPAPEKSIPKITAGCSPTFKSPAPEAHIIAELETQV
jgi:hypothetical protein